MGPILLLGPNVITDGTFDSLHLGPVITLLPSTTCQSESSDCGLCVVNQSNGRAMLGEHIVI